MSQPLPKPETIAQVLEMLDEGQIEHFCDIPENYRFGMIARDWLRQKYLVNTANGEVYYAQVPESSLDDRFIRMVSCYLGAPTGPSTLFDAVGLIKQAESGGTDEALGMVYAMTYPLDQVVTAMTGNRLKKLLLEMYTAGELRPYLMQDTELKGVILEAALGI
jgi:hypothetical protein